MQKIDAANIGNMIKREGQQRWNMKYDELVKLCCDRYSFFVASKTSSQSYCIKEVLLLRPYLTIQCVRMQRFILTLEEGG